MPLEGQTLVSQTCDQYSVDCRLVGRKAIYIGERQQFIPIEYFRQAVAASLRGAGNAEGNRRRLRRRASSGLFLILSQVPFFEYS